MDYWIKRFSKSILSISILSLFLSASIAAQVNLPSSYPDRIILNLGQDAANSVAVTWRTNKDIKEGFCQLQLLSDTRIDPESGKTFKASTKNMQFRHENEPVIYSNHHSYVFTDLI